MPDPLDRRRFLSQSAALVPLAAGGAAAAAPAPTDEPVPPLILRQHDPVNLEMPFASLDSFVTPIEHFYVRNHFAQPTVDAATWKLKVEGEVERPLELTLDELHKLPSQTATVTLECAGNGRVFLEKAHGVQWGQGAVSTAEWTGVPLAAVLKRAGIRAGAVEVVLEGADQGAFTDEPKTPGTIHYARSVPMATVRERGVLLAYRMNGQPLPRAHGSPMRALVPGWYGMAAVKWLTRILVVTRPFLGYFQTLNYSYFERTAGLPSMKAITAIEVKSAIARPTEGEVVPAGKPYTVHGAAWSGAGRIAKVEVSTDGGHSWSAAKLVGPEQPFAWRLWEFHWDAPATAGPAVLMARATDAQGRTQPMHRDPDRRAYMVSHVLPITVTLR